MESGSPHPRRSGPTPPPGPSEAPPGPEPPPPPELPSGPSAEGSTRVVCTICEAQLFDEKNLFIHKYLQHGQSRR